MNERIKELAIQAAGKGFQTFATSDFDSQAKIQKFAELIIRRCAGIDFRHKVGMTTDQEADTSRAILEHFGIAE